MLCCLAPAVRAGVAVAAALQAAAAATSATGRQTPPMTTEVAARPRGLRVRAAGHCVYGLAYASALGPPAPCLPRGGQKVMVDLRRPSVAYAAPGLRVWPPNAYYATFPVPGAAAGALVDGPAVCTAGGLGRHRRRGGTGRPAGRAGGCGGRQRGRPRWVGWRQLQQWRWRRRGYVRGGEGGGVGGEA